MSVLHGYTLPLVADGDAVRDATGELAGRTQWPSEVTGGSEESMQCAEGLAKLFAAAPEMASAIKESLAQCRKYGGCQDAALLEGEYCSDECSALASALLKAGVEC